jgi:hypothetical protein
VVATAVTRLEISSLNPNVIRADTKSLSFFG